MAKTPEIIDFCWERLGVAGVKSCHVGQVRAHYGISKRPPKHVGERKHPCPPEKWEAIEKALRHFRELVEEATS